MDKGYAPMNDNLEEKYVTYKSMNIAAAIFSTLWILTSCQNDLLREKIHDLDKRLTRTEAICYGTGQSQSD